MDREAWHVAVHGVTKNQTQLSDWTELNTVLLKKLSFNYKEINLIKKIVSPYLDLSNLIGRPSALVKFTANSLWAIRSSPRVFETLQFAGAASLLVLDSKALSILFILVIWWQDKVCLQNCPCWYLTAVVICLQLSHGYRKSTKTPNSLHQLSMWKAKRNGPSRLFVFVPIFVPVFASGDGIAGAAAFLSLHVCSGKHTTVPRARACFHSCVFQSIIIFCLDYRADGLDCPRIHTCLVTIVI